MCVVDPRKLDAAETLRYWVRERGCRGLRLRPRTADEAAAFDTPATGTLWQAIETLGVAVNVLAGSEHLPMIAVVAKRYPGVPILIDHLANPGLVGATAASEGLLRLAEFPEVYVKLSGYYYFSREAYPYRDCRDLVRRVRRVRTCAAALGKRFSPRVVENRLWAKSTACRRTFGSCRARRNGSRFWAVTLCGSTGRHRQTCRIPFRPRTSAFILILRRFRPSPLAGC